MVEKIQSVLFALQEKKGIIGLPTDVVVLNWPSFMGEKKQFVKAYRHNIPLAACSVPALSKCLSVKC